MSSRPSLAVHLVFHPGSRDAHALARAVDDALNGRDPVTGDRSDEVPHIAIPTFFLPVDPSRGGRPPLPPAGRAAQAWREELWFAERNLVVVLSDEHLAAPPIEGEGDPAEDWSEWVHTYGPSAGPGGASRLLPVQLTEEGWPLHASLRTTSFVRLLGQPGDPGRTRLLVRRVVQELCRQLRGLERPAVDAPAPVDLFLSHAKADLSAEPRVVAALLDLLKADHPVRAWVDSGDIPPGWDFSERIGSEVAKSSVLCVLTDHYSSRPWCRTEARLAKELDRPMVVVDALTSQDVRSSPYLGNVPVLRWSAPAGDPGSARELAIRAVDLLVLETLRRLHARLEVERCAADGGPGTVLTTAPEPLTLLRRPPGTVYHPDPPLADDDAGLYADRYPLVTPSSRYLSQRNRLAGTLVGISVSGSPDLERFGVTARAMDDAYLELTRALLLLGASVGYGGHFGKSGYTLALFDMVQAYRATNGAVPTARVVSWVGWPNRADAKVRARYKDVASFRVIPRPADPALAGFDPEGLSPPPADVEELAAWSVGMTALRERMTAEADARLLLGGKLYGDASGPWYLGRMPGVLEEAWLALRAGKPLYLLGAWGGASRLAGELLRGRTPAEATWAFHRRSPMAAELHGRFLAPAGEALWGEVVADFHRAGWVGSANGLTEAEADELFECRYVPRIVELVALGLSRVRGRG